MLGSLAATALLALAPLLGWRWLVAAVRQARSRRVKWGDPTVIAGAMLGLALLALALPQDGLGFYPVFGVGGFWDVTFVQLLALVGNRIVAVSPSRIREAPPELLTWLGLALGLWLFRLAIVLPRVRRRVGALVAAEAATCLASALGAGWAALLVVWTAGQLNVWLLLVAILLIQDARYAHPPRSRLAIMWLWDVSGRFRPTGHWLEHLQAGWNTLAQFGSWARFCAVKLPKTVFQCVGASRLPGSRRCIQAGTGFDRA